LIGSRSGDGVLLDRFLTRHDEGAFATLLQQYWRIA
jgi:hypothetical protein